MAAPGKRPEHPLRALLGTFLVGLSAGLLGLLALDAPAVDRLEAETLDWRFQLRGPLAPSDSVALVVLDEPSLEALGGWPPSRRHLAAAVNRLAKAGVRTLTLDLLFKSGGEARSDADRALAAAIARAGNVVMGYAFSFERGRPLGPAPAGPGVLPPMRAALTRYLVPSDSETQVPQAAGAVLPDQTLAKEAAALGHMSVLLDPDGALRHEALLIASGAEFFPSIAVQSARRHLRLPPSEVTASIGRALDLGRRRFATDARMRVPVNFYGPGGGFPTYSLVDLLAGRVADADLAGRAVVLGSTVLAAAPGFVTPYDPALPPAAYTATVLDNLLTERALTRPDWLRGLELLAAAFGAGLTFAAARRVPPIAAPLAAAVPAGAWAGLALLTFVSWHVWLATVVPVAAMLGGAGLGALARSRAEQRRRQAVARERENLSRYFSPAVAERLAQRRAPGDLTGVQDATVLFVDLVGSTRLCERLPGAQAIELLRGFHQRVERAVFTAGGTLDKYLGDGALAVFGVPDPQPDEAARALACAVDLQESLSAWSAELRTRGLPPLGVAIGVHHGPVLMGDIGGESRLEFTVLGDTVNVASRLEGLTRTLGVAIVASEATIERARRVGQVPLGFHRHGEVQPRGREGSLAVWVWQPLAGERAAQRAAG